MPDCDRDAWWDFRPDGEHSLSKHEYEEVEVIPNCEVQILKCRACGKISVGWKRQKKLTLGFELKDMQEVVRCSECKFASSNATVMTEYPIMRCNIFRAMTDPNGFCYKGERK